MPGPVPGPGRMPRRVFKTMARCVGTMIMAALLLRTGSGFLICKSPVGRAVVLRGYDRCQTLSCSLQRDGKQVIPRRQLKKIMEDSVLKVASGVMTTGAFAASSNGEEAVNGGGGGSNALVGVIMDDFDRRYGANSQYSKLIAPPKVRGLSKEALVRIIERDLSMSQYFVTGNLTRSIYRDDCRFKDPTTDVRGLKRYILAVQNLFDPKDSKVILRSISSIEDNKILAKWSLQGSLKLPWKPYIQPYEGTTTYWIDPEGLIEFHDETWSITATEAFLEIFGIGKRKL